MNIKNNDSFGDFLQLEIEKNHKTLGKYADFESNKVQLLKILLNNPKSFIKQKVLRIILYP